MNQALGSKGNKFPKKCFICGSPNHMEREFPDRMKEVKCFKCGKFGHKENGCNQSATSTGSAVGGPSAQKMQGRVFALDLQAAQENPNMVTGTIRVCNLYARFLVDSGATHSFISSTFGSLLNFTLLPLT